MHTVPHAHSHAEYMSAFLLLDSVASHMLCHFCLCYIYTSLVINFPLLPPSNSLCQVLGISSNLVSTTVSLFSPSSILPSSIHPLRSCWALAASFRLSMTMWPDYQCYACERRQASMRHVQFKAQKQF